jgi:hypothetical protein
MGGGAPVTADEADLAAAQIRADIKAAVKDSAFPPYPEGITFRVQTHTAPLVATVIITITGAPGNWAFDHPGDVGHRTVISADAQELAHRLRAILRERWKCDGSMHFGFIHLGAGLQIA